MERSMRKLIMIVPLLAACTVAAPARAVTIDPPQMSRVTFASLRHEIAAHRVVVGPNRMTGYGKLVVTGLTKISGGRYRAAYKVTNVGDPRTTMGTRTLTSCWPWESGTLFGCSSPLDPKSWDWKDMLDNLAKKARDSMPDKPLTYNNQKACASGAIKTATYGTVTKTGVGYLFGLKDYVRITPQGYAMGVVAGCLVSMWW